MTEAVAGGKSAAHDAQSWRERDAELVAPVYSRYSDLVVDSAEGSHLYTVDGRDILDFGSGIAVTNLGHRHPEVVAAVHAQLDKLWHVSVTALHPRLIEAAERLTSITPEALNQAFFCNSGAEAVEASMKLARRATGRTDFIAFHGAFHGRTYGALSLTASNVKYRNRMGPFLPGVHHVTYPHCMHTCTHAPGARCPISEGVEIERLFQTQVAPSSVAAIIVEPVQGEGGYIVPPARFLPRLREICDEHGILLIADEVQSGLGRTGKMFAIDHWGVVPDILCVAKALGNGLPVAAIVAKHSVMRHWEKGEHGTTYGGNPVACAAAIAVIDTLVSQDLPGRAAMLGQRAMKRLNQWPKQFPELIDVRGLGLMIGLEFQLKGKPAGDLVDRIQQRATADGLLCLIAGTGHNVIRLIPPLTISEADLDKGLDILENAIGESR